jgi:hypothetical protein
LLNKSRACPGFFVETFLVSGENVEHDHRCAAHLFLTLVGLYEPTAIQQKPDESFIVLEDEKRYLFVWSAQASMAIPGLSWSAMTIRAAGRYASYLVLDPRLLGISG